MQGCSTFSLEAKASSQITARTATAELSHSHPLEREPQDLLRRMPYQATHSAIDPKTTQLRSMGGNSTIPSKIRPSGFTCHRISVILGTTVFGKCAGSRRASGSAPSSLWLSSNPSKQWAEHFFLLYTPFWLTLCLGIVVPFNLYEVSSYYSHLI